MKQEDKFVCVCVCVCVCMCVCLCMLARRMMKARTPCPPP